MGETVRVPAEQVLHVFHPATEGQIRGVPWVAPAMVRLWLLDKYDDAELDRKKVAAMFAGFVTRSGPDDVMGEDNAQKDQDGAALIGLQPGTMQLLLPSEGIKFSDPADVGGSYEAFQYRTFLACCSTMGVPYTNVTGDLRQANYSSLREGKLEFRRRIEQLQHGTLVFQLCRQVWQRWLRDAVLAGALNLPGFASEPARYIAVKWIPPKWDWVDPLKDREAGIEVIEAGLKSRSDVIESEGYDAEEVDRRIVADHAREERSLFDGIAIYNALKRHQARVTIWIDGIAASIASMIAMAGDEVVMPDNAMLVLHDPSGLVADMAADMRAAADALDKMAAAMVAAYRDKSGAGDEEIAALMAAETWLSAEEAVDLGLADRVEQAVRMAAHFDLSRFRNTPRQLAALAASATAQDDDMPDPQKKRLGRSAPTKVEAAEDHRAHPDGEAADVEAAAAPDAATDQAGQPEQPAAPEATSELATEAAAAPEADAGNGSAKLALQPTAQVIDLDAVRADERRATLAYVAEVHDLGALAGRVDREKRRRQVELEAVALNPGRGQDRPGGALGLVVGHHDRQLEHQLVPGLVQVLDQLRLLGGCLVVVLTREVAHRDPARQLGLLGPGLEQLRRSLAARLVRRQAVVADGQHRVALTLPEGKRPVALDHVEQIRLLQFLQRLSHRHRARHQVAQDLLVELRDIEVPRLQACPAAELADDAAERDGAVPARSNQSFQTPPWLVQSASVSGSCTAASSPSPYRAVTVQLAIGVITMNPIRYLVVLQGVLAPAGGGGADNLWLSQ